MFCMKNLNPTYQINADTVFSSEMCCTRKVQVPTVHELMRSVNFHHCEHPMNSSCACQISVGPANQVHVSWISWLFSQQSWLPHRDHWQHHIPLWPLCVIWEVSPHRTLRKISLSTKLRSCSRKSYSMSSCVINLCVISLFERNWWVSVKNSSSSSYTVSLAIIFTISRHESLTPILKRRVYSHTEL